MAEVGRSPQYPRQEIRTDNLENGQFSGVRKGSDAKTLRKAQLRLGGMS